MDKAKKMSAANVKVEKTGVAGQAIRMEMIAMMMETIVVMAETTIETMTTN
ncbi:hypothetical protein [Ruegeria atlantica]|uniref:hypothetical protein n=1 Tax=Ruegeria atlantica TaxID=81569 RepID=UPI00147C6ACE|nr:hypothetical protein [Ruegeria atlantica]